MFDFEQQQQITWLCRHIFNEVFSGANNYLYLYAIQCFDQLRKGNQIPKTSQSRATYEVRIKKTQVNS